MSLTAELHKEQHESTIKAPGRAKSCIILVFGQQHSTLLTGLPQESKDTGAWNPQVEQMPLTFKCNPVNIMKHSHLNI